MARSPQKFKGVLSPEEYWSLNRGERRAALRDGYRFPPMAGGAAGSALESNILGLWAAMQPDGRGTPADMTVASKMLRWVGGDLTTARADGTEPFSDNSLFGDTVDFVNTILGNGAPVIQGQSGPLAWLSWLACGQETVTPGATDEQTFSSTATGGTFKLEMNGYISAPIPFDCTEVAFQAAFLAAVNASGISLPAGGAVAAGGPFPATPITLTAAGKLDLMPWPVITIDDTALVGGAVTAVQTTTGAGVTHVASPNDAGGFWSTWFKTVGRSTVIRHKFNDCRISSLRYEGSSASKVFKLTPTLISLDPGELAATDPTKGDDGTIPFLYTEGAGTWTIDDIVFQGHSSFAMEAMWGLQEWYGDDVVPYALVNLRANLMLQAITILLDDQGLGEFNQIMYGSRSPAVGSKPIHEVSPLGSYGCEFTRKNRYTGLASESAAFDVPSVKWDPGLSIQANVAGGPVDLPLAAEFRKLEGSPAFTVTTVNADAAYAA